MFYQDRPANDRLSRQGTPGRHNLTFFAPTYDGYQSSRFLTHLGLRSGEQVNQCRLSKDYERLCVTSEALIYLAVIRLMVRRLTRF
jgi:hypothetical protein